MIMNCIDAGSENCPCHLALTGDCLTCCRLQGKDCCDCNWQGVCIYNEFIQGNRQVNQPRKDMDVPVVRRKFYRDDLVVFVLDVGKGLALKYARPGSYLLIKPREAESYYETPISVMKSDVEKGQIHLAVKIFSAKTKVLLQDQEQLTIRGPYRNGIHGILPILSTKAGGKPVVTAKNILVLAKGVGIAPAVLTYHALCQRYEIDLVLDPDKISKELISDYFNEKTMVGEDENRGIVKLLPFAAEGAKKEVEQLLIQKRYGAVIILTSDYYLNDFGQLVKDTLPEARIAMSNNFRICCGEGLCGACVMETVEGDTIKMCKCQITGNELLEQRKTW